LLVHGMAVGCGQFMRDGGVVFVEAFELAAGPADEVGVVSVVLLVGARGEPPNPVAHIDLMGQALFGEGSQDPINGDFVGLKVGEFLRQVFGGDGFVGFQQCGEDRDPRHGAADIGLGEHLRGGGCVLADPHVDQSTARVEAIKSNWKNMQLSCSVGGG